MNSSPLHFFPLTLPYTLILVLLVAGLLILLQLQVLKYAYEKLGLHPYAVLGILMLSLLGGFVNIPVAELPKEKTLDKEVVRFAGVDYVVPVVRSWPGTVIAVNVGGAVVPALLSIYLVFKYRLFLRGLIATAIVALVVHKLAYPVKGLGIATPTFVPPIVAAGMGLLIGRQFAAPLAYVAGCMGTLIGADLLNLDKIQGLGASMASIGGAGTYDGVFLTGIFAVLLTWSPAPKSVPAGANESPPSNMPQTEPKPSSRAPENP